MGDDEVLIVGGICCGICNYGGLIGFLVLDITLLAKMSSAYITYSGSSIMRDARWEMWLCIGLLFFATLALLTVWDDDTIGIAICAWVFFFMIGVAFLIFMIRILSSQTDTTCNEKRSFILTNKPSNYNTFDMLLLRKEMGIKIGNTTDVDTMLTNLVDDYCDFDYNSRAWCLGFSSPALFVFVVLPLLAVFAAGGSR